MFQYLGPDGAIYVLDFYREVIETPLSLPADIKKKMNLESRGRGRIWRIVPELWDAAEAAKRRKPALGKATTAELVAHLADGNLWWRLTAQRLLVERQDKTAVKPLEELARTSKSAVGRAHALWTLDGLKALDETLIAAALKDAEAGVREQALRLSDSRLKDSARLRTAVAALTDDPSPTVRFQLAFTLGEPGASATGDCVRALAKLARRDDNDTWTQTAILSSAYTGATDLLLALSSDASEVKWTPARLEMLKRVAALAGARADDDALAAALGLLGRHREGEAPAEPWQAALLEGLARGQQNSSRPLAKLWDEPPPALRVAVAKARTIFEQAAKTSGEEKRPAAVRAAAVQLLGYGPFAPVADAAPDLLHPQTPPEVQLAVIRALGQHPRPEVAALLLAAWSGYSPAVRREALEALVARPERVAALLTAVEQKKIVANQIEPIRIDLLRKHPDAALRKRAVAAFAGQIAPDRQKIVEEHKAVLDLKSDAARGKLVFAKTCATCHRLENVGFEVGPDLLSALRNKSPEQLLIDILDPSREVDARYLNYVVRTKRGQAVTGMIAAETSASVTLRRGEKAEDTILRDQIEKIETTTKSLMPEGLEMQLSKQDLADVIVYLQAAAAPKK